MSQETIIRTAIYAYHQHQNFCNKKNILRLINFVQESPRKPNQRKGQNKKFMNFAHFCEFWCFSSGKQARFTLNFCSGTPLRKVHELTFFGLVCRGHSWFVKNYKKYFPALIQNLATLVLDFVQYPRDSPRSAWELQQKKSALQRIPVKITKKNSKKKKSREGN